MKATELPLTECAKVVWGADPFGPWYPSPSDCEGATGRSAEWKRLTWLSPVMPANTEIQFITGDEDDLREMLLNDD